MPVYAASAVEPIAEKLPLRVVASPCCTSVPLIDHLIAITTRPSALSRRIPDASRVCPLLLPRLLEPPASSAFGRAAMSPPPSGAGAGAGAGAVTLPEDGPQGTYKCHVDHRSALYSITWSGTTTCPDLSTFPASLDTKFQVSAVNQSPDMARLWQRSTAVAHGAFAHIRRSNARPLPALPILKLAHHDNSAAVAVIQHEYRILCDLATVVPALPVPRVAGDPIRDRGEIVGYRMEELHSMPYHLTQFPHLLARVKHAVKRLHDAGFSHGDLSPSNVMQDSLGRVVLIDFGCSGRLGEAVPPCIPYWVYPSDRITKHEDVARLSRNFDLP